MFKLTDLREILRYVPSYRERVFVIAVDGELVAGESFTNLLLDIALLRSLSIQVVIVHGASYQLRQLALEKGVAISNDDGTGITDQSTLHLALTVANRITHEVLEGLSTADLRAASTNACIAHPAGILRGIDTQFTGRVERIDAAFLQTLLKNDIVPVIPPLGFDGEGRTYRVNSDSVALEVALALRAIKLIYVTAHDGIVRSGKVLRQLSVSEAAELLSKNRGELEAAMVSKLEHGWKACQIGVERVHIINGRVDEGLLAEVFSPEGVGTLIYGNQYQAIRPAVKKDAGKILRLIAQGVQNEELVKRTRVGIEKQIGDYYVFEIDKNAMGCVALHAHPETSQGEMACLSVHPQYSNRGIGRRLMAYVEKLAREKGLRELFCLSTQAFAYFQQKGGFREATPEQLPASRQQQWEQSKRNSRVLVKSLTEPPASETIPKGA